MYNELTPDYLSSLVPPYIINTTAYQLCNTENLKTANASSQLYINSFFPSVVHSMNEIPTETRNQTSLRVFRCQFNTNITYPSKFYSDGKRLGEIYHSRLRTN